MTGRRGPRRPWIKSYLVESHTVLVGANEVALSYLKMLDAFNVDHASIRLDLYIIARTVGAVLFGNSRKARYPIAA